MLLCDHGSTYNTSCVAEAVHTTPVGPSDGEMVMKCAGGSSQCMLSCFMCEVILSAAVPEQKWSSLDGHVSAHNEVRWDSNAHERRPDTCYA